MKWIDFKTFWLKEPFHFIASFVQRLHYTTPSGHCLKRGGGFCSPLIKLDYVIWALWLILLCPSGTCLVERSVMKIDQPKSITSLISSQVQRESNKRNLINSSPGWPWRANFANGHYVVVVLSRFAKTGRKQRVFEIFTRAVWSSHNSWYTDRAQPDSCSELLTTWRPLFVLSTKILGTRSHRGKK